MNKRISRRDLFKMAGGATALLVGASVMPQFLRKTLMPEKVAEAAGDYDLFFGGTDGWMYLPGSMPPYHPDPYAPTGLTTYIFGFRNLTNIDPTLVAAQKNKAQHNAPLFWLDQFDPAAPKDFKLQLTNLGLAQRPDLVNSHTLHWHGFRNVIPYFDGEPTGSISVPTNRYFTYVYRPRDPGTYMYHCHVEDVEHVHMGMTGIVFVRALQNKTGNGAGAPIARANGGAASAPLGYVYNDGVAVSHPLSTAYDREFPMFLSEVWTYAHYNDAHIQDTDWSLYKADYSLLNGRVYPYTLAPGGGGFDPLTGDLIAPVGHPELQYQPHSALVECNAGEKVLLRFANLGFREAAMTFAGLTVKVVGRDATPMKGRDGTDTSFYTDTLLMGAGESYDVIFTAPPKTGAGYDTYVLFNRRYTQDDDQDTQGQRTEIRVYASGVLPAQNPTGGYGI